MFTKMKLSLKITVSIMAAGLILASCEGPMGPQGEEGPKGDKGDPGTTLGCADCHNSTSPLVAFAAQWQNSTHNTGGNASYCNMPGCVQCHTQQGFLEAIAKGSTTGLTLPTNPMQIGCGTCHKIHQTYSSADWALTNATAQTLNVKYKGSSVVWDKGSSNQCVYCHQMHVISPAPVLDGPDFAIANVRLGPHHAPHANMILGSSPFELPGNAYPTRNPHSTADGCLTCHMAPAYVYQAGGHNMGMWYTEHGQTKMLTTGCKTCHPDAAELSTKVAGLRSEVTTKMQRLESQLAAAGIYNTATRLANTGTFKANAVIAYLNYASVKEDSSNGLHFPRYTKVLLDNSIAMMESLGY